MKSKHSGVKRVLANVAEAVLTTTVRVVTVCVVYTAICKVMDR